MEHLLAPVLPVPITTKTTFPQISIKGGSRDMEDSAMSPVPHIYHALQKYKVNHGGIVGRQVGVAAVMVRRVILEGQWSHLARKI
uniref:Phosphorylase b kinase regulatory subunit n=1 Tax=Bursaphelenchus xylophilus TaxID=6326 RepID=A0A1I7RUW9_BURXY